MIKIDNKCDICGASIEDIAGRPGFPQLIWCYFKKGLRILQTIDQTKKALKMGWLGSVNRRELCPNHANEFNILLKAFFRRDKRVGVLLSILKPEDATWWKTKQEKVKASYEQLPEKEKGESDLDVRGN